MLDLFRPAKVKVVDGDTSIWACPTTRKPSLRNLIDNGLPLRAIQILHYATVHYITKWDTLAGRFATAFFDLSSTISYDKNQIILNNRENSELKSGTSEVLGVGLGTLFMCKWFGIRISSIERIEEQGKRCDYQFIDNGSLIAYETKGRAYKDRVYSAQQDVIKKKRYQKADEKYSVISFLPRDGNPIVLYVFDPPSERGDYRIDRYLPVVRYYQKATGLAGFRSLSNWISLQIESFLRYGEWETDSIGPTVGLTEYVGRIRMNDRVFMGGMHPIMMIPGTNYYMDYTIDREVLHLLANWQLDELLKYSVDDLVVDENYGSILNDGTLLRLRKG